jgi:lysophospholipase L1-like esterase
MHRRFFIKNTFFGIAALSLASSPTTLVIPAGKEGKTIINAGVAGNNSTDLLARVESDVLRHKPDLVILMVGTNDVNSRKHVSSPQYAQNLGWIADQILRAKSRLLLMTILPAYEPYLFTRHPKEFYGTEGSRGVIANANEIIRQMADEKKVPLLDLFHIYDRVGNIGLNSDSLIRNEANSGSTDGIHPTPEGYRVIAIAVHQFILQRADLNACRTIVCFGDSITAGGEKVGMANPTEKNYPGYLQQLFNA